MTETSERVAVIAVGSRLRRDVHRSGRGQFIRQIKAGLTELELLNGTRRNVLGRCTHGFVGYVDSIHLDARAASESAAEGNRRIPNLGRVEVGAVLNLHSGFELREVEEVTAIYRQVLDLAGGEHSLHRGLFGIHPDISRLD